MNIRSALLCSVFAVGALAAGSAHAAPGDPVSEWSWQSTGTFVNWTDSMGASGTDSSFIFTQPTLGPTDPQSVTAIGWGGGSSIAAPPADFTTDDDFASIVLSSGSSSGGATNITTGGGDAEQVIGLNFRNANVAASSIVLDNAEIRVEFDLTPEVPADIGGSTNVTRGEIALEFFEVDNDGMAMGESFGCVGGTTPGGPCGDIIIVNNALNNAFEFNDVKYVYDVGFQEFGESAFGDNASGSLITLTDDQCGALGQLAGCQGFFVQEAYELSGAFTLDIRELQVTISEPLTLGLFGSALAGLGLMRRRRVFK